QLFLQGLAHFFGAFVRARSLRVIVGPAIGADEEVALALRHARRFAAGALAVNSTTNAPSRQSGNFPGNEARSRARLSGEKRTVERAVRRAFNAARGGRGVAPENSTSPRAFGNCAVDSRHAPGRPGASSKTSRKCRRVSGSDANCATG